MYLSNQKNARGFTLIETVIAIGVLAVLLSGFMVVFAPAAAGIRESINSQAAARLVTTVEEEMVTVRGAAQTGTFPTGFHKAFDYIRESTGTDPENALLVYKYRASLTNNRDSDGTPEPITVDQAKGLVPGVGYVVQNMMRRKSSPEFIEDLDARAIEGPVYLVKCTQLLQNATGELQLGTLNVIANPPDANGDPGDVAPTPDDYNQAVITFIGDFYSMPANSKEFFQTQFTTLFTTVSKPVFSRNLAVRR